MGYQPLHDSKAQDIGPPDVEIIEMTTKKDEKTPQYTYSVDALPTDAHSTAQYHQRRYQPSEPPPEWPFSQRVYVATLTPWRTTVLVFDVLLASAPVAFIVFAVMAAQYDNRTFTANGNRLLEILKYCPSVFPVMFAALMGRFFHSLGLYLAERGTTLGRLENLIGAQSFACAVELLMCLRSWSLLSFLTVLAWFPSPFGGQAALRVLKRRSFDRYENSDATFRYFNPSVVKNSDLANADYSNSDRTSYGTLFLASIVMSSTYHTSTVDPWANVKLPTYRSVEANSTGEWKLVQSYYDPIEIPLPSWSSLVGIPVDNTVSSDVSSFDQSFYYGVGDASKAYNISARQFDITCSSNERMGLVESGFGDTNVTWKLQFADPVLGCPSYPCSIISKSLAPPTTEELSNFTDHMVSVAHCEVTFEHLQAEVLCKSNADPCYTKRVRKLNLIGDDYTLEVDETIRSNALRNLMLTMPTSENIDGNGYTSTIMERWMADSNKYIQPTDERVALWNQTAEYFAGNLTVLWNSYFTLSYAYSAIDINLQSSRRNNLRPEEEFSSSSITTPAKLEMSVSTYQTNWKWFSVLLACSSFLLVIGYAGLVIKYKTIAPDIIGYASSLTMLNPYVPTPTGGTTLDGLDRAALLHDLPIKIGDVCPNDPVGVIVLAKADEGMVGSLNKNRLYM